MEPQLFSRGNQPPYPQTLSGPTTFNGAAAFQPRKFEANVTQQINDQILQWSRSFSAAEIDCSETHCLQRVLLELCERLA